MSAEDAISDEDNRYRRLIQTTAVFALLLFGSTWKLWSPQTEFPQIPFFEFLTPVPGWIDWIGLGTIVAALVGCVLSRSRSHRAIGLGVFALAATGMILLNQHRLQPWAYQLVVFAILISTARPARAWMWMQWIVISIYVFSSISKLDYQFVHTVGDQMLQSLNSRIGIDDENWSATLRHSVVLSFPLAELLIGIGLSVARLRRLAIIAAATMHLVLILVLIGNIDGWGVLLWNLYFFVFLTFWWMNIRSNNIPNVNAVQISGAESDAEGKKYDWIAAGVALFVIGFPLTQPLGICDHWPAWQVYAPRTSRAFLEPGVYDEEARANPSAWSNRVLKAPVYPQARFQLAVAMAVQEKYPAARSRAIVLAGESNRWTGERSKKLLTGDQGKMEAAKYWLNLQPRQLWHLNQENHSAPGG